MEIIIGVAVFALQLGGYALWRSYMNVATESQLRADRIATRARAGCGNMVGGSHRLGED